MIKNAKPTRREIEAAIECDAELGMMVEATSMACAIADLLVDKGFCWESDLVERINEARERIIQRIVDSYGGDGQ